MDHVFANKYKAKWKVPESLSMHTGDHHDSFLNVNYLHFPDDELNTRNQWLTQPLRICKTF